MTFLHIGVHFIHINIGLLKFMKIKNIEIRNFRNLLNVESEFGPINIITGRNSSGKTNFLKALSHIAEVRNDFTDVFFDNIVTYGPGKKKTDFKITLSNIGEARTYYRIEESAKIKLDHMSISDFIFINSIEKTGSSKKYELFYSGKKSTKEVDQSDFNEVTRRSGIVSQMRESALNVSNELVYQREFKKNIENADELRETEKEIRNPFLMDIYKECSERIHTNWVDDNDNEFSSNKIFNYVTEKYGEEEQEQVVQRINKQEQDWSVSSFSKAKFIHLLADIQRDKKAFARYCSDLSLYTENILTKVEIATSGSFPTKGTVLIESPASPKSIATLSAGTVVLLYFITLKNWIFLDTSARSYRMPSVMLFDEVESIIHPSLTEKYVEVLRGIASKVQIFITTHSPHFIDRFTRDELFWLKDTHFVNGKRESCNSNMYTYADIISKIPGDTSWLEEMRNSELFSDGTLDDIFPTDATNKK